MSQINYRQIQFSVLGVFLVIFGLLFWFLNTSYYLKKEYFDFKKLEFNATIFKKVDEHPVHGNKIYLKNGPELNVPRELFDKIKIGDSVLKKANSDSVFFKTEYGIIIDDYNDFKRKKYFESLK